MVHTNASTQKTETGAVDLGPGRGQRRPNRRHVNAGELGSGTRRFESRGRVWTRRGEGPGGRGEGVGLLVGGVLRGILGAQQYPLSPFY